MEPLLMALVLGLSGGLALSLLIARNRRGTPPTFVPRRLEAPTPALINMAQIRVEGIGGLGMVAAVIAVAIADSRIRMAIVVALVLGVGLAVGLIAWRRRGGPLSSAGGDPDDRSLLHLEVTEAAELTAKKRSEQRRTEEPGSRAERAEPQRRRKRFTVAGFGRPCGMVRSTDTSSTRS